MPGAYTVDGVDGLIEDESFPIIDLGEMDENEKKVKLFDVLGQYQANKYIAFIRYPGNNKLKFEIYPSEALLGKYDYVYALIPFTIEIMKDLIDKEYEE
ncbi:MAG: hypothetical protein K9L56_15365 [Clostridiales bacterium]|nr:hypothetical protein [Clostridiales bacterium]